MLISSSHGLLGKLVATIKGSFIWCYSFWMRLHFYMRYCEIVHTVQQLFSLRGAWLSKGSFTQFDSFWMRLHVLLWNCSHGVTVFCMYRYMCMYIWNQTPQLHIMGVQHIHAGCRIQKSKGVAPCEQCHSHQDNPLHAIKTQSHSQNIAPFEWALRAVHAVRLRLRFI